MPQPQEWSSSVLLPPDDTFQSSTSLGTIAGLTQLSGSVGPFDRSDYYRFTSSGGRLDVELAGMTSDADLEVFDSQLQKVGSSYQSGNLNEWVTLEGLTAGNYYVHVRQYSGETNYQLSLIGTVPPPSVQDAYEANNTIATAYNLGDLGSLLESPRFLDGYIGFRDTVDYYRFSVSQEMELTVGLTGLSSDIDLQIFRNDTQTLPSDTPDWSLSSTRPLTSPEQIRVPRLGPGTYYLKVYPAGNVSSTYRLSLQPKITPQFEIFEISDASGDASASDVFKEGALRVNTRLRGGTQRNPLVNFRVEAIANDRAIVLDNQIDINQGSFLINLKPISNLNPNSYQVRSIATFQNGETIISQSRSLTVSDWTAIAGTIGPDELDGAIIVKPNAIVWGNGGTDSLKLGVASSEVVTLNGRSLMDYQPMNGTVASQVIFGGTTFDYLRFKNGREIYFQGVELLQFLDRTLELQVRTNDPGLKDQWNLQVSDVESAWRFTQGDSRVLLVSLDTGILTAVGAIGGIEDIDLNRLITDPTDDDNYNDSGHGHRSISILSAVANNGFGIAGINWKSNVLVHDLYGGGVTTSDRISFHQAIRQTLQYARSNKLKVVFQGGMQGEYWLTDGGTQAELEQMIRESEDIAFYAIAAGNGNVDIDLTDASNNAVKIGTSGGVARLQATHQNLASVGAATPSSLRSVNGLMNAQSVNRADYSNYGQNLTLMAATNVPTVDKSGNQVSFGGTSAANPNLAAIASLVWSMNLNLTAVQLRQILIDTAMDLGAVGRDDATGYGLLNADAAVRRAMAIGRDRVLAGFWRG